MARGLGELLVLLGLNTTEYTRGLTKAERDAQRFARNVRTTILDIGAALGGLEIGRQVFDATKAIIGEAAALNDLADATGSSVESLSRLTNQAKIAGTDLATLQTAMLKLSAGMAGADEESTKAKEALKLLGITTKDPAQALQEIALKFDTFADGVNKVGLAVALFGKNGGQMVATLKDIANLQDVAATTTARQAAEAEKLEQAFRRLSVESTGFKNAILNDVVPALTRLIAEMTEGIRVSGSFGQGIEAMFAIFSRGGNTAEQLSKVNAEIETLNKNAKRDFGPFRTLTQARDVINPDRFAFLQTQRAILLKRQREEALALIDPSNADARDLRAQRKPEAPFIAANAKAGAAVKERISDTDRLIESLEKQQQATLDLSAEETILVKLWDLQHDGITVVTEAQEKYIRQLAQIIQGSADAKKAAEEAKRAAEEDARIREQLGRAITQQVIAEQQEAKQIQDGNDAIREQIAFIKGGEEAVRKLTDAKLADTIAQKENLLAVLEAASANQAQIDAIKETIDLLKQRQGVLKEFDIAKKFAEEAKALQDVKNMISDTFANAFSDFITGAKSAKDAFKAFTDSIVQQVSRIAAQNIANALFGGKNQAGPDIFGVLAKLLASSAGGSAGSSLAITDFSDFFAAGGVSRGGLAVVGERGPELVNLPRGARVTPNHQINQGGGRLSIVQNINVPRGADTATLRQSAKRAFALAAGQMRRG